MRHPRDMLLEYVDEEDLPPVDSHYWAEMILRANECKAGRHEWVEGSLPETGKIRVCGCGTVEEIEP